MLTEEPCVHYEYLVRSAFGRTRMEYKFIDVDYCRQVEKHPEAFVAYLQCTLIVLANRQGENETLFNEMALRLDRKPSLDCAFDILNELHEKGIVQ